MMGLTGSSAVTTGTSVTELAWLRLNNAMATAENNNCLVTLERPSAYGTVFGSPASCCALPEPRRRLTSKTLGGAIAL